MTRGECTVCAAPFEYDETRRGRRRKQCSKACTNAAHRARRSAIRQAERQDQAAPCEQCGQPVSVPVRGAVPRWCSVFCNDAAKGRRLAAPLVPIRCALPACEVEFTPHRRGQRCCSERHGKALWNRESRADGRQPNPAWDDRRRDNYHRRRALKAGTAAESINHREVYERDGWMCGLCAEPVDGSLAWPDPRSASLDHVTPLSLGGAHVLANVQLAHLGCNVEKGARVPA